MRSARWWQYGLFGGVVLSLATIVKLVRHTLMGGAAAEATWTEAIGFAVAIFGMGFVCGVVVWAGRWISQRHGRHAGILHRLHALVRPRSPGTARIANVRLWGAARVGWWNLGSWCLLAFLPHSR
jgi:hypothetical protein